MIPSETGYYWATLNGNPTETIIVRVHKTYTPEQYSVRIFGTLHPYELKDFTFLEGPIKRGGAT